MGIDGSTIKQKKERDEQKAKAERERADRRQQKQQQREEKYKKFVKDLERNKQGYVASNHPKIDCAACKSEGTMLAAVIPRFGGFVRFIGLIIVFPSILGVLFSISILFNGGILFSIFSIFVFFSSLVGGLVGYLLLMNRKVFKCTNCSYILDRG